MWSNQANDQLLEKGKCLINANKNLKSQSQCLKQSQPREAEEKEDIQSDYYLEI